jgi:predicted TIM-barrel fold metal-dependent hydrolase
VRIWDIHVHFPRGGGGRRGAPVQQPEEPEDPQKAVDHLAERLREVGTVKASLLCAARNGLAYEQCIDIAMKHEDLFVPHAVIDPGEVTYERAYQLNDMGYKGFKIIGTPRPYDHPDHNPAYKAAEELDMPILFHCGVISGGIDLLRSHPRRDPESAKRMREMDENAAKLRAEWEEAKRNWRPGRPEPQPPAGLRLGRNTSAMYMRPFHLETIANRFPRLKIIGAHFGGTGNYDEAASVARWRRWVYFDMSGGRTLERHAMERGLIGQEIPIEKLIFGSDCPADEIHLHVERFTAMFEQLGLTDEEKDLLWYRNAAEMFGAEEPVWAPEPEPVPAAP